MDPITIALPIAEALGEGATATGLGTALASNPVGWGTALGLGASALWNAAGLPSPTKAVIDWYNSRSTPTKSVIQGVELSDEERRQMAERLRQMDMRRGLEQAGASKALLDAIYNEEAPAATTPASGTPAPEAPASGTGTAAPAEGTASGTASGAAPAAGEAAASGNPDRSRIGKIADAVVGGAKGAVQGVKDGYNGTGGSSGNSELPKNEGDGGDKKGNGAGKKLLEVLPGYGYKNASTTGKVVRGVRDLIWANQLGGAAYDAVTGENTVVGRMRGPVERNDNTSNVQRAGRLDGQIQPKANRGNRKN